ncbi:MAG: hypothetical protein GY862_03100 [Gammaproteobacteria bacterium]|nr:hypothetical protein [Gammaproteobacteria bacterium]
MDDEIIQEMWQIKDAMAKRFNYDIRSSWEMKCKNGNNREAGDLQIFFHGTKKPV